MNDLHLWRSLRRRDLPADQLADLLRQLDRWPLDARHPFLGLLAQPLAHADPAVRAAALSCLAGASGLPAYQHLVAGLHDADPTVRQAAVAALRESSAAGDSARFVHALFHSDPEIRRAAVDPASAFPLPAWYRLYLLPDPACADSVRAALATTDLPAEALPVLADYGARGIVPPEQAAALLFRLPVGDTLDWFLRGLARSSTDADLTLAAANDPNAYPGIRGADNLDEYFTLAWGDDAPAGYGETLRDVLVGRMPNADESYRKRYLAALVAAARRLGTWPASLVAACGGYLPGLLVRTDVALEVRRAAVRDLARIAPAGRLNPDDVDRLIKADVCTLPGDRLDLVTIAAALHQVADNPYHRLTLCIGRDAVRAALAAEPALVPTFLSVPGNYTPQQRAEWVRRFCLPVKEPVHPALLAVLLWMGPNHRAELLSPVQAPEALVMLGHALEMTEKPAWALSRGKAEALPRYFASRLKGGHEAAFLDLWMARPNLTASPLGRLTLTELASRDVASVVAAVAALPAESLHRLVAAAEAEPELLSSHLHGPLVEALVAHADEHVRNWAVGRLPAAPPNSDSDRTASALPEARGILSSTDVAFLAGQACSDEPVIAQAAAEQLLALSEAGEQVLADLLRRPVPPPAWRRCMAAVITPSRILAGVVRDPSARPEVRFRLGLVLLRFADYRNDLLDAVCAPDADLWYQDAESDVLIGLFSGRPAFLAKRLLASPHPTAQVWAVTQLTEQTRASDAEVRQAMHAFLDLGPDRHPDARFRAAAWLHRHGDRADVLPVLLRGAPQAEPPIPDLLGDLSFDLVEGVVGSVLAAGRGEDSEKMVLALLKSPRVHWGARQEGLARLMSQAASLEVRQEAKKEFRPGLMGRYDKLRRVARVFAWGVRIGRQLTGKTFRLEMLTDEQLGYTRLRENKLYITPLPLLRGEAFGTEIVQGLILHEYGHHLYHKGEAAEQVWAKADQEHLARLLNLVADEHLERNLRARNRQFGDWLKLLAAYAFQHTARQFPVDQLLGSLRGRAFQVLTGLRPRVARRPGCVAVSNGDLLLEMERAGMSFARFVRALRMGLGNRHRDPKVAQALALFHQSFRHSDMPQLLEIARKLREIFGEEAELLEHFAQDRALAGEGMDGQTAQEATQGITSEELQEAIKGVLEVRQTPKPLGEGKHSFGRLLNLSEDETFPQLTDVIKVPHDPAEHARYAEAVARPAKKLRQYLDRLGLGLEPERPRARGHRLDRTRLQALPWRRDPRLLVAREIRQHTDLHIGVLIDCSGSMHGENHEKAKRFGTLVAEGVKGHRGIDLRLYGFTDQVIYDCGNARQCGVHGLTSDNGNNDAAALWHAAREALASPRRARLLVMISDGSPTGCSVAALKALVERLTRRCGIACAQVAVCPLEHVCFPHYIVLEGDDVDDSVRRFGQVVMKLVGQVVR